MQVSNRVGVGFQLGKIILAGSEHYLLGINLAARGYRQAQLDLVGGSVVAQRFLLHHFRSSGGIDLIRRGLSGARRIVSGLQPENGEPAIKGQGGNQQAELAGLVVNQLASHSQVYFAGSFPKIIFPQVGGRCAQVEDMQRRTIFAVAVRQHAVTALRAFQIDGMISNRVQAPGCFCTPISSCPVFMTLQPANRRTEGCHTAGGCSRDPVGSPAR